VQNPTKPLLTIDIDNKESIQRIDSNLYPDELALIKEETLERSVDECLTLKSNGNLIRDKLLGLIRKEIYSYRSSYFYLKLENQAVRDPLVCRCTGKVLSDVKALYHEHKGDQKKILLDSHIAGVCGSCLVDFKGIYSALEIEKTYIEGLPSSIWVEKVEKLIEEFYFVCPAEFSNLKFEVISMNSFNLKIRCDKGESSLKRVDIMDTLANYFKSELKLDLKLSVVI
jgi:hypothetical protein